MWTSIFPILKQWQMSQKSDVHMYEAQHLGAEWNQTRIGSLLENEME